MFGFGKKYPYVVTVLHSGRHPYMGDPTYDMFEGLKQEQTHVMATGYDDAAKRATAWGVQKTRSWSYTVIAVRPENAGDHMLPGRKADHYKCGQKRR